MSSEWPVVNLKSITSILGDGLHGTPEYDPNGEFFFINGNNLADGKIVLKGATKRTSESEYQKYRKDLNDRTILVSINGTLGNVALYQGEKVILGKSACYLNIVNGVDRQFVRYVLSGETFQEYIHGLATGSTIKNVSLKLMRDFSFRLPPLDSQNQISAVLSALDDRITLLQENNTTLEAIAEAMFKSWFIDFEPVHAKMEGRAPQGMDEATAALFPGQFEESELGAVPKGWTVAPLSKYLEIQIGGAWGEETASAKSSVPVSCIRGIDAVDIAAGNKPVAPTRWVSPKQISCRALNEGDILVEGSGSFCGRSLYWIAPYAELFPLQPTYSNFVKRLSSQQGKAVAFWGWVHINRIFVSGEIANYRTGSAFPNLDIDGLLRKKVIASDARVIDAFADIALAFLNARKHRIAEADSLKQLRRTLLPQLLSGRLRLQNGD